MASVNIGFGQKNIAQLISAGLLLGAASLYLTLPSSEPSIRYKYTHVSDSPVSISIIALVSVLCLFFGLKRLIFRPTAIRLDRHGYLDKRIMKKPIPWTSIQSFQVQKHKFNGHKYVYIAFKIDPETKKTLKLNLHYKSEQALLKTSKNDVLSRVEDLDIKTEDALELISLALETNRAKTSPHNERRHQLSRLRTNISQLHS